MWGLETLPQISTAGGPGRRQGNRGLFRRGREWLPARRLRHLGGMRIRFALAALLTASFAWSATARAQGGPPSATPPSPPPAPVPVAAVEQGPPPHEYSIGLRLGGYGFKNRPSEEDSFDHRKMGGIGVFGQRTFGPHLFGEVGLDLYASEEGEMFEQRSTQLSAAIGIRTRWAFFVPFAQAGAGIDLSRVKFGEEEFDEPYRRYDIELAE